ncbi:unnamed protein product [Parnassius apollo]|uniref:(apollo) hypothetical protein n=1 Tax=Parnassius apollo TaxID=110799 RepID=A0A8S3X0W9_PARAO|nr:unnamed protein product [Parnassius apollo]
MPAPDSDNNKQKVIENNAQELIDQPVREITQTDHLNKKLLTSLFNRMVEGDSDSSLAKMLEPDNINEEHDEWSE